MKILKKIWLGLFSKEVFLIEFTSCSYQRYFLNSHAARFWICSIYAENFRFNKVSKMISRTHARILCGSIYLFPFFLLLIIWTIIILVLYFTPFLTTCPAPLIPAKINIWLFSISSSTWCCLTILHTRIYTSYVGMPYSFQWQLSILDIPWYSSEAIISADIHRLILHSSLGTVYRALVRAVSLDIGNRMNARTSTELNQLIPISLCRVHIPN